VTPAERAAVVQRITDAAARMLTSGEQGIDVEVDELGEVWTVSREPS
jgi:phenylpyruvate tautomerase PptA (4-oxalocrotonate tautomerase family)